ncbi:MAG: hypothetical protein N2115_08610 [bacterium]|nr:hypothetical protein [bacterium]
MNKLVMRKKAADNVYFHPDFHIAMNMMIDYIEKKYGKKAVTEYLEQFANAYYKPLKNKIKKNGLRALRSYIEQVYKKEGGNIKIDNKNKIMQVYIEKCPAISHIKKRTKVANSFVETTRTIYQTIVENTGYDFELKKYDSRTGKAILIFRRKQ